MVTNVQFRSPYNSMNYVMFRIGDAALNHGL